MYELTVERVFSAAHALLINGQRESLHGHNWRVRLIVEGPELDADGLLCDFHLLERELDGIIRKWDNQNLNQTPPFDRVNPTAELVARTIADAIIPKLPPSVLLNCVRVTEAPGCEAVWKADR